MAHWLAHPASCKQCMQLTSAASAHQAARRLLSSPRTGTAGGPQGHPASWRTGRPAAQPHPPCARLRRCTCRALLSNDLAGDSPDDRPPYGDAPPDAGIPVAPPATAAGQRLWDALRQQQPHAFVTALQEELQQLAAAPPPPAGDRLAAARRGAVAEDALYLWALAEAYLQQPGWQDALRVALRRAPGEPLAQAPDGRAMLSRCHLLDGREGAYMIGCVQFGARGAAGASALPLPPRPAGVSWPAPPPGDGTLGGGSSGAGEPKPALEGVFGSGSQQMQLLLAYEGSTPSRMSREGAARTYHMYALWGYFQKRMAARRAALPDLDPAAQPDSSSSAAEPPTAAPADDDAASPQVSSSYGETGTVWKYFENVPPELSQLRTREAATVADRHLRALFGEQPECITTLIAWQHMCQEARWFGRALHDAEELVLQLCPQAVTLQ